MVENRPGATGTIATTQMKRAAPDGYTLLVNSIGTYVTAPHLLKGLTFHPRTDLGIKIVANTQEEFTAFRLREYERWKKLVDSRGIKAD